ncbi:MAG: hypothetical protein V8R67_01755 [Eubacterium sp.]
MDFGDIILGIVDVGILVGIFVSFYQMICTKKRIKTNGCKAALKKLLLCEGYLLAIGIIQLWVVLYPPFVIYTWNKVLSGWMEKFVWLERGVYLLETVIVLPISIVIVSIVTIKESQRKRGSKV